MNNSSSSGSSSDSGNEEAETEAKITPMSFEKSTAVIKMDENEELINHS